MDPSYLFDQTDQSQDSTDVGDVLSGALSSSASSVISGLGDSISSKVNSVITGAPPPSPTPSVNAVNKPQLGTAVAKTAGISGIAILAIAAFFLLR